MAFICTTNDRDFGPTRDGAGWEMLSSSLRKELGPEFELLLAKPVPRDGKTDWYVDLDVKPVQAAKLSGSERAAISARLDGMRRQVLAYADRLAAPNSRTRSPGLAADLRSAMRVPRHDDDHYVWSVNGQPMLVAWGLEPLNLAGEEGVATEWGKLPEQPKPEPVGGESARKPTSGDPVIGQAPVIAKIAADVGPGAMARVPWAIPLWLLFIALVGTSYFLLLQGCAFSSRGAGALLARILPNSCSASAGSLGLFAERQRRDNLVARIRDAELDATRLKASCSSEPPKRPQKENQKRACSEVQKRLQENQAQAGALEVTLQWNGLEDLDLWVSCPGGHAAANPHNGGACESKGDIDWNYQDRVSDHPIEHIVWKQYPPVGHYQVDVRYFDPKGPDHPVPFDVFVKRDGVVEGPFHGVVQKKREEVSPYAFDVGPQGTADKPQAASPPQSPQCDAG